MKILITGVLGSIGSILKQKLLNKNHIVFGIDLPHASGECGFIQTMSSEYQERNNKAVMRSIF